MPACLMPECSTFIMPFWKQKCIVWCMHMTDKNIIYLVKHVLMKRWFSLCMLTYSIPCLTQVDLGLQGTYVKPSNNSNILK